VNTDPPAHDPDPWFHIETTRADLRARSARSGALAMGARGTQILLNFGAVVVLARILRPEDFGVLALVLPITILFNTIANGGLQNAVMHEESLDHAKASALFWFAAAVNLGLTLLFVLAGPLLSKLYADPRATGVALVWGPALFVATLSAIHEALLKRQLRFRGILLINVAGIVVGIAVAIVAALLGAGYWALLLQFVVADVFRAVAVWGLCGWRPSFRFARDALNGAGPVRRYWRDLAGFRFLNWLAQHPDRILVGRVGGAAMLGFYDSGRRWAFYPFVELFMSLSDVAIASFSRVAGDPARYRAAVRRGLLPVLALPLPAIAFIFLEARDAVLLLLGDQWLAAVPFVRLMCVASFFGGIGRVTQWFYLSRGETDRQLRWAAFVQTPIMLAAVLIGTRWGAIGVAAGFAAGTSVLAVPSIAWCLRGSPFGMRDFILAAGRPTFAALSAAAVLAMLAPVLPDPGAVLPRFVLHFLVYATIYLVAWRGLPGGREASGEIFDAFRDLRSRPTANRV
jgi:PST family polysaccharide transporter